VLIPDQRDHVACAVKQGLTVLASAEVELQPLLHIRRDIVIDKVGNPPPHLEATDLDDCFSVQHHLWAPLPFLSAFV
jgi:hypothetical protein